MKSTTMLLLGVGAAYIYMNGLHQKTKSMGYVLHMRDPQQRDKLAVGDIVYLNVDNIRADGSKEGLVATVRVTKQMGECSVWSADKKCLQWEGVVLKGLPRVPLFPRPGQTIEFKTGHTSPLR